MRTCKYTGTRYCPRESVTAECGGCGHFRKGKYFCRYYNPNIGDNYEPWEKEVKEFGGREIDFGAWLLPDGCTQMGCKSEWDRFKHNGYAVYMCVEKDGTVSLTKEEHESWERGMYGD